MICFATAFVAAAVAARVLASPAGASFAELAKRNIPNAQGTNNGYFYQFCMCNAKINPIFKALG
jgi:endo-1,4-beta-xylanase